MHDDQPTLLRTVPMPVQQVGHVDDENVIITLSGSSLVAIIKDLDVRITARWHVYNSIFRYINYRLDVPRYLCGGSFGHLGNCDRNPSNDESGPNDCKLIIIRWIKAASGYSYCYGMHYLELTIVVVCIIWS